jgi:hypothetical protein
VAVHLGSLLWPKPPQVSGGSLLRPKPFAVLRVGPLPGRGLSDCPVDRCFDRSLRSFPVDRRLDRSPPGSPEERRLGRSLLIFPFGVRRDRGLWQVSRIPAWAEALAVHRSVPRVRPKPWRFTCPETPCRPKPIGLFRPARMSAEAGILSGWLPVKAEALAARLRSAVSAEAGRFLRAGSPSEPKLFRFSFGGSVKPKLLVPPGCSTKLADPCKS